MILCDRHGEPSALPDPLDPATGAAFYPHAAKLQDLVDRLRQRGGDDAIPKLLAALIGLLPGHLARFGSTPPADAGMQGRYITRMADALAYHWLAAAKDMALGLPSLEEVLRVRGDVLAEVCLAEGVCQGDDGAREYFYKRYAPVIAATARRIGGRAPQELEGLPQDLVCDPRPLASYRGLACLNAWLWPMARNEWSNRLRAAGREAPGPPGWQGQLAADVPTGNVEGETGRLAELARRAVGVLSAKEVLWLKMFYLEKVPQVEIARLWGVNKATVCRHLKESKRRMLEVLQKDNEGTSLEAAAEALGVSTGQLAKALAEALSQRTDEPSRPDE